MLIKPFGEAISIADKIVVMTKRPGTIKNVYDIPFKNEGTPIEKRSHKEFNNYFNKIWEDLDIHE